MGVRGARIRALVHVESLHAPCTGSHRIHRPAARQVKGLLYPQPGPRACRTYTFWCCCATLSPASDLATTVYLVHTDMPLLTDALCCAVLAM